MFVPGYPITQGSGKAILLRDPKRSNRRCGCVARYVPANAQKLTKWRRMVRVAATTHRPVVQRDCAIWLVLRFYLPEIKEVRLLPYKQPDLDKLERAVLDALTGVVYEDDGQVTRIDSAKRYGRKPGVMITVQHDEPDAVDDPRPLFDNPPL